MALADAGEEEDVVVRGGGEEVLHEILVVGLRTDHTLAATLLHAVDGRVHALDIAVLGECDNGLFVRDEVLLTEFTDGTLDHLGLALIAESVAHLDELALHESEDLFPVFQKVFEVGDQLVLLFQLVFDLLPFQTGQRLKAHLENSGRLQF